MAGFEKVLHDELDCIQSAREQHGIAGSVSKDDQAAERAHRSSVSGLALSGGGIRSATFNLGVLQALAELKLLRGFDYLSTVSGGGYIGGWLSAWINRHKDGLAGVEKDLTPGAQGRERIDEPQAIGHLRSYSNYLTPRSGFLTADVWAGIATYLRNFLINCVIFVSLTAAMLMLPLALARVGQWFERLPCEGWVALPLALFGVAVFFINLNLFRPTNEARFKAITSRRKYILCLILAPCVASAWLGAVWFLSRAGQATTQWFVYAVSALVGYLGLGIVAAVVAAEPVREKGLRGVRARISKSLEAAGDKFGIKTLRSGFWYFFITVAAIAFGFALLAGCAALLEHIAKGEDAIWSVTVWGMPALLAVFGIAVTMQIGLMGRFFPEEDREWWSRLGGWLMIAAILWVAIFGAAIYGPLLVLFMKGWARGLSLAWVLTTVGGVIAGRSEKSGNPDSKWYVEWLAKIAPYAFVAGFFLLIAWGLFTLLPMPAVDVAAINDCPVSALWNPAQCPSYFAHLAKGATGCSVAVFVVLVLVGGIMSWRADVNLFSFHMFYRNRLIRCYLGASKESRKPDPFTDFDSDDAPRLKALQTEGGTKKTQRPYHLINTALNITSGSHLAWQERKAAACMLSPRWCGFQMPKSAGSFQRTEDYVKTVHGSFGLGTAMAISGAAASPNMGFHSSPPIAFLMTLFNVRLGWWMQNPARSEVWTRPGPTWGLIQLMKELFGLSNEESNYVYLSDGGHFENLGIYELVRRRCKFILVIDAGADPKFVFDDLGGAIRKCYVDFGIRIDMGVMQGLKERKEQWKSTCHFATGVIHYENVDKGSEPGTLIYLKPSLTGNEPADIINYRDLHPEFPHQSTHDQWFDESQFEAYRKLGYHIAMEVLGGAKEKRSWALGQAVDHLATVVR
jgi:hypothetical protein